MIDRPLVSVIVPIYNAQYYMNKCIDSILNQTLKDIEIILINDGSLDNSGIIADQYADKDDRIKVIHQENSGPSVARNRGIDLARGKYIGFVDSDDYIELTMYEELYSSVKEKNIQVAMCGYNEKHLYNESNIKIRAKLDSNKIYDKEEIENRIISTFYKNDNYGFYSLCNKIYHRDWLLKSKIIMDISREHGEDWWFNINILSSITSFVYIDRILYNYIHSNSNSLMFKYRENQFDLFLDGRLKMKEIIPHKYMDYNEFNKRFIYEFSSYIIRTIKEIKDNDKRIKLIADVLKNEEVIESCANVNGLPIHYNITSFLIKNKFENLAKLSYGIISKLR